MADADRAGRPNQRNRTRKDLLQAASRLMKQGRKPTLEEVAEEAQVSRATAYRYFPGVDTLLLEASLDVAFPYPEELFASLSDPDPKARLRHADDAVEAMILGNEPALRMMLIRSLERALDQQGDGVAPRQNRRMPLIEAALAPARGEFDERALPKLKSALALVIGTEAMLVFKDVLQMNPGEARSVRRWMIDALLQAARFQPDHLGPK